MNTWEIKQGDVLDVLKTMASESVHCCVTSPPYWGLRDYGTAKWEGGDDKCNHKDARINPLNVGGFTGERLRKEGGSEGEKYLTYKDTCPSCGATKKDSQLGLEKTPEEYVAKMTEVFRLVRRVLRADGTLWLNIGDSYCSTAPGTMGDKLNQRGILHGVKDGTAEARRKFRQKTPDGMKPKDLVGIPWMLAFALRSDGWYLRSDIIWSKPNPMPESVTDRPTKAHEYVFLMRKSANYFFDQEAVREAQTNRSQAEVTLRAGLNAKYQNGNQKANHLATQTFNPAGRNLRSVWSIPTQPYKGSHFATFPEKLVEPCVKAGTSEKGCCGKCGGPWERVVKKTGGSTGKSWHDHSDDLEKGMSQNGKRRAEEAGEDYKVETLGWHPTCSCQAETIPCTVLDIFAGSGTVGVVALRHSRNFIGIELNPSYIKLAEKRIGKEIPMFSRQVSSGSASPTDPVDLTK